MLNLELELVAVLILTAVIGLLMGRFLCKSGESEEREEKKKVIHALETSQHELELSRESVKKQFLSLKERENKIAKNEQDINNFKIRLKSSDMERAKLLEELKVLEKYKPRFESLDKEFHLQSKIVEGLNYEKVESQKEISDFQILTNGLDKNVQHLEGKQKELESTIGTLEDTLKKERIDYEKKMKEGENSHSHSLLSKDEKQKETLFEINQKHLSLLKSKESACEKLEKDSTVKYQKMVENRDKLYAELKKEKETIVDEYEEFKENYNLDRDRLNTLEIDYEKIYETLESIVVERDDLMTRLRAISSVVGAVGVDRGDNPPALLENK